MTSESEHSNIEFSYPGELSDSEMPQLPTHNEATERKSPLSENWKCKKKMSYDKILIDLVRSGRTGKYLALCQDARTSLRSSQIFFRPALPLSQ